jgi:NAD(P)-dependent dehydrogenase (short-subunit alcohol dehydrogenase family)
LTGDVNNRKTGKYMRMKKKIVSFLNATLRRNTDKGDSPKGEDFPGVEGGPCYREGVQHEKEMTGNKLMARKNVLITGAGRNIGRSIAIEMAGQGANVFFTDIDAERCEQLSGELREYGGTVRYFLSDISKIADIDSLCRQFTEEDIYIDVLVHNAGIRFEKECLEDLDMDDLNKVFHTNVFGPLYLTKCIGQVMVSHNIPGSILFTTSIHEAVTSRWLHYSSSKAALRMIVKELAIDLADHGIRVNGIAPGWVAEDDSGKTYAFRHAPLHRSSIHPCYIGRAAVYLASEYFSKFTTGTIITVDAGLSLHSYLTLQDR